MTPSLDSVLNDEEFAPRLAASYRVGHWVGGLRKVFGPVTELSASALGEDLETHPSHYLVALWMPPSSGQPFLARWPFKVAIVAPDPAAALRDLLVDVPMSDRLWLTGSQVDWALMAEIVMLSEPGLLPYQYRGLKDFAEREREEVQGIISRHYTADAETTTPFARTRSGQDE